ncbi:MAG: hypothetical protein AAGM21_05800 [Pseudomonadota bacterium]
MLTSIYLQRRRLLFGMFFFFLAGLLDFGRFGMWDFPVYVVGMSVLFATICGAIAVVGITLFPAYRQVFEIVGVSFLGLRLAEAWGIAGPVGYIFDGAWGVVATCLFYTLLFHGVYGLWWAKTPFRLAWTGRSRFHTSASPAQAWARLVPAEDRPGDYYSGTLHEFRAIEDGDFTHLLRTRMGGPQFLEQRVTVTRHDANTAFAYTFDADVSEGNRALNTGDWRIELTERAGGTQVDVVENVVATTPANALLFWFDDLGGQVAVSMKRTLEGRRDPTLLASFRRQVQSAA